MVRRIWIRPTSTDTTELLFLLLKLSSLVFTSLSTMILMILRLSLIFFDDLTHTLSLLFIMMKKLRLLLVQGFPPEDGFLFLKELLVDPILLFP